MNVSQKKKIAIASVDAGETGGPGSQECRVDPRTRL